MATYVNDLRLKEIATGDESGTWGTSTNTNLELIAEAFSYGTEAITTNADTHTTTIADGSTDPGRSIYLKYTGTLDSACTITIGPNTVSKLWFIENATSGSQNIIISQGSGANITIPAGDTKVVYSDGAGSGAAFFDAFANLKVTDPAQTNITSVGTLTGLTVNTGTTNGAEVSIISTNTANSGANNPTLKLYRSGVLSGGFGQGGLLEFAGQNASGTEKTYATISGDIFDTTASSEDGYLTFRTMQAGTLTTALEIDHQGFVGIGTTSPTKNLDVSGEIRASTGILFGSDTAAANTLDDYEEGTWRPTIAGQTSAGTYTYGENAGVYTKIGNQVTCTFYIVDITVVSAGSGNLIINNFPFTAANVTAGTVMDYYWGNCNLEHFNVADATVNIAVGMDAGTTNCLFWETLDNNVNGIIAVTDLSVSGSADVWGQVTYRTT
jgi:hypothetical protein